jgi:O-antigen/teichoic acid export membrane protein
LVANTAYFVILTNVLHSTVLVGVVTSLNILIWFFVVICILAQPVVLGAPIPAPLAVLKFVPEFLAKNDRTAAALAFKASLVLSIILGLVVAGILTIFPSLLVPLLGGQAIVPVYLGLSAVDILVIAAGQVCLGSVVALGGSNVAASYCIVWSIVRYAFASALLLMYGVAGVLMGWILGDLALFFLALHWTVPRLNAQVGPGNFSAREFAHYGLYTLFAALTGFVMNQADRLFALWRQGLSGIAIYNVAMVGAGVAGYVPYVLVTVLLPAFTAISVSDKTVEMDELIRSYTRYVSLVVVPIGFGLASVMMVLLRIFGSEYVTGFLPAAMVSIATGMTGVGAVYAGALLALGKLRWYTAANLMGLLALFGVAGMLTPVLGLNGPALGRASLMAVAAVVYALAAFRNEIFVIDLRTYVIAVLGSSVMALMVFCLLSAIPGFVMKLIMLPPIVAIGLLAYVGSLRASHLLTVEDLNFIRDLMPNRLRVIIPTLARLAGVDHRLPKMDE